MIQFCTSESGMFPLRNIAQFLVMDWRAVDTSRLLGRYIGMDVVPMEALWIALPI
jgi:hypothetical protein